MYLRQPDGNALKPLKPRRLTGGDLIGIVSPAGPISDTSKIDRGVRYLESLGYRVTVGKNAALKKGYLAGSDKERVDDLHSMFANGDVRAIFCMRGGYGTPRLLRLLDYRLIARNPKILVGFSDITALQLALWHKCRLITFHGPMVGTDMAEAIDPYTEEMFWRILSSDAESHKISLDKSVVLHRGSAVGRLLGGNLSLIVTLIGTPWFPRLSRAMLFIEEIGEEPYRIDRMLTQLKNAGILDSVSGILSGQLIDCVPQNLSTPQLTADQVLDELQRTLRKPFLANAPFGHHPTKLTLPVGVRAKLDTHRRTLTFLESPVQM
jgi:muramoyltetrapeptide carboxypeptidase